MATPQPHPSGPSPDLATPRSAPARPGRGDRLALAPADVLGELAAVAAAPDQSLVRGRIATHFPVSRRASETRNSFGRDLPVPASACRAAWRGFIPTIWRLGLGTGSFIRITGEHDSFVAEACADAAVRRGVLSMPHGWGGLPDTADP